MPRSSHALGVVALVTALTVPFVLSRPAAAHERRQVGAYAMSVGWADEPTYAGFKNAVQLLLKDKAGKPVTDLADTLKVEVVYETQKSSALGLDPAWGTNFGTPGDYRAAIVPTRPGNYTFHFIGSINDQKVDQSFTSSDKTFDPVVEPAEIEFPAKDPSAAELAGLLERLGPRIDAAQSAARDARAAAAQARILAVIGIVLFAAAVVVSVASAGRRAAR